GPGVSVTQRRIIPWNPLTVRVIWIRPMPPIFEQTCGRISSAMEGVTQLITLQPRLYRALSEVGIQIYAPPIQTYPPTESHHRRPTCGIPDRSFIHPVDNAVSVYIFIN